MNILPLIMIVAVGAFFWLFILRPARARANAQAQLVNEIKVGDRVMTTAGLFGTVRALDDEEVGLEVADGVVLRMVKAAIAKRVDAPEAATAVIAVADGEAGRETEGAAGATSDSVDVTRAG